MVIVSVIIVGFWKRLEIIPTKPSVINITPANIMKSFAATPHVTHNHLINLLLHHSYQLVVNERIIYYTLSFI
jgi:hypothetical protein